ncbi:hypothetical protein [Mesorhizobium sp. M1216]|uniref:hypothetical protein n=1 Tax=Mesorhizobium sp. M1216 TaxID=2957069 RepID=UPI003334D004
MGFFIVNGPVLGSVVAGLEAAHVGQYDVENHGIGQQPHDIGNACTSRLGLSRESRCLSGIS